MPQNLSPEDVQREVLATLHMQDLETPYEDLFCNNRFGGRICSRHKKHHGKHADAINYAVQVRGQVRAWHATKVVRW